MSQTATQNDTRPLAQTPKANLPAIQPPRLPFHPVIEERFGVDKAQWKALVEAIFPLAQSVDSVCLALSYCRARKLDPFKKNVHIVPIWDSSKNRMVDTIWPGIGELRTTAFRTGHYAGKSMTEYGSDITKKVGNVEITFPEWAQITVKRILPNGSIGEFSGPKVYWLETYTQAKRADPSPNSMWMKRPRGQLEKCFDDETEVLTDEGFQLFSNVTGRILQVAENGLEETDAKPFSQPHTGEMVCCDSQSLNFCVTANHDMLTKTGKVEAFRMFNSATKEAKFHIPLTVSGSREDCDIDDESIKVAAAIVCDGYKHGVGSWNVAVSRQRKVDMLESLGAHRSRYICKAGGRAHTKTRVIVTKSDKVVFVYGRDSHSGLVTKRKSINVNMLLRFSRRQANLLVDSLIFFDGNIAPTATRFYSSSNERMAAFELACIIAGRSVSPRTTRQSDIGKPSMMVTVSKKSSAPVLKCDRPGFKVGLFTKTYSGKVWCCRVPSGVIVVRRHGLSMLCGNCAESAALRAAFPEELGNEHTNDEMGAVLDTPSNQVIDQKPSTPPTTKTSLRGNGAPPAPVVETAPEPESNGETVQSDGEVTSEAEPQPDETDLYWSEFSNNFEACLNAGETDGLKSLLDQYRETFIQSEKYAKRFRECVALYEGQVGLEPPKAPQKTKSK